MSFIQPFPFSSVNHARCKKYMVVYSQLLNSSWVALFPNFKYLSTSKLREGSKNVNHFNLKLLNTLENWMKKSLIQALTKSIKPTGTGYTSLKEKRYAEVLKCPLKMLHKDIRT